MSVTFGKGRRSNRVWIEVSDGRCVYNGPVLRHGDIVSITIKGHRSLLVIPNHTHDNFTVAEARGARGSMLDIGGDDVRVESCSSDLILVKNGRPAELVGSRLVYKPADAVSAS